MYATTRNTQSKNICGMQSNVSLHLRIVLFHMHPYFSASIYGVCEYVCIHNRNALHT